MKPRGRTVAAVILLTLFLLLVGPFLVPLPPLTDTLPVRQLADEDSRFVQVNGLDVHYKEEGSGEPVLILMHGFGASLFSWHAVMEPLAASGRVIAYDRPGFGLTQRPMPGAWSDQNPYSPEAQVTLLVGLMDALGVERAVLVGNSAGGAVAVHTALRYPERVQALVLVDAAIYTDVCAPAWARPLLATPQMGHLGPLFVRGIRKRGRTFIERAWHDPGRITPDVYAGYEKPLQAENWDRALWELAPACRSLDLEQRLSELSMPVLVVTGDDDRIVPTGESLRLAQDIPAAGLVVFPACGHTPQEECPQAFLEAVLTFLEERL